MNSKEGPCFRWGLRPITAPPYANEQSILLWTNTMYRLLWNFVIIITICRIYIFILIIISTERWCHSSRCISFCNIDKCSEGVHRKTSCLNGNYMKRCTFCRLPGGWSAPQWWTTTEPALFQCALYIFIQQNRGLSSTHCLCTCCACPACLLNVVNSFYEAQVATY